MRKVPAPHTLRATIPCSGMSAKTHVSWFISRWSSHSLRTYVAGLMCRQSRAGSLHDADVRCIIRGRLARGARSFFFIVIHIFVMSILCSIRVGMPRECRLRLAPRDIRCKSGPYTTASGAHHADILLHFNLTIRRRGTSLPSANGITTRNHLHRACSRRLLLRAKKAPIPPQLPIPSQSESPLPRFPPVRRNTTEPTHPARNLPHTAPSSDPAPSGRQLLAAVTGPPRRMPARKTLHHPAHRISEAAYMTYPALYPGTTPPPPPARS